MSRADEVGHLASAGPVVQTIGRVPLGDRAGLHHPDHIGHRERFVLVVGDQQRGRARLVEDVAQFHGQPFAQVRIEVREWLVQQQQAGRGRQRTGQRHALLLTARQFVRKARGEAAQSDQIEHALDAGLALAAPQPGRAQSESDVVADAEVRKQRVVLEHDAHAAVFGFDPDVRPDHLLILDPHRTGRRFHESGDGAQRGGLAAPGCAQQAADAPLRQLEAEPVDHAQQP
jgi:hypothetical protein